MMPKSDMGCPVNYLTGSFTGAVLEFTPMPVLEHLSEDPVSTLVPAGNLIGLIDIENVTGSDHAVYVEA
jgi:hypothetical protein